jgi:trigger factor
VENDFLQMAFQQMRSQAERDVRGAMLLEKIAEAEGVNVKPEEVEDEIAKMADYYRSTVDELKESLEKQGGTSSIENNLRTRKSIEALFAKTKVSEGEWTDPNAETPAAEPEASSENKPRKTVKKKKPAKEAAKEA